MLCKLYLYKAAQRNHCTLSDTHSNFYIKQADTDYDCDEQSVFTLQRCLC